MKPLISFLLVGTMAAISGCSSTFVKTSTSIMKSPMTAFTNARRPKPVSRILCLWEAAEGQGLDEKPSRGFAGQIMFFSPGEPSPVKVNGIVRIYEYVDFDDSLSEHQPIHEFIFDDGGWNAHRTESTLGETYNVFLPYVLKDGRHNVCALRVEFESEDGRKVSSPYTEVTLASKTTRKATQALARDIVTNKETKRGKDISPVSASKETEEAESLESMSIKLPARQ